MAETLEALKARREKLLANMSTGVSSIRHGDEQVVNRSIDEIQKALASLDRQIAKMENNGRRRVRYAFQSGKGL